MIDLGVINAKLLKRNDFTIEYDTDEATIAILFPGEKPIDISRHLLRQLVRFAISVDFINEKDFLE